MATGANSGEHRPQGRGGREGQRTTASAPTSGSGHTASHQGEGQAAPHTRVSRATSREAARGVTGQRRTRPWGGGLRSQLGPVPGTTRRATGSAEARPRGEDGVRRSLTWHAAAVRAAPALAGDLASVNNGTRRKQEQRTNAVRTGRVDSGHLGADGRRGAGHAAGWSAEPLAFEVTRAR